MADFAVLREEGPFTRSTFVNPLTGEPDEFFAVTRYAELVEISRHAAGLLLRAGRHHHRRHAAPRRSSSSARFINMDDPRHARQRGIVARSFTPRQLQGVLDSVETICTEVIDDMCEQGEVDLVEAISAAVPAAGHLRHDGHPAQRVRHRAATPPT